MITIEPGPAFIVPFQPKQNLGEALSNDRRQILAQRVKEATSVARIQELLEGILDERDRDEIGKRAIGLGADPAKVSLALTNIKIQQANIAADAVAALPPVNVKKQKIAIVALSLVSLSLAGILIFRSFR